MTDRPKLPPKPPFCSGPFRALHEESSWIIGESPFGGGEHMLDIRGWGFLTGRGQGLALSDNEAAKAQRETMQWVIDAMNVGKGTEMTDRDKAVELLARALCNEDLVANDFDRRTPEHQADYRKSAAALLAQIAPLTAVKVNTDSQSNSKVIE
jgi:hypothetical protein